MSEVESNYTSQKAVFELLKHLMNNLNNHEKGRSLVENTALEKEDQLKWQAQREAIKNLNTVNNEEKKEVERKQKLKEEEQGVNILGPELYEIVFGRLSFKIRLSNIKIYFEKT